MLFAICMAALSLLALDVSHIGHTYATETIPAYVPVEPCLSSDEFDAKYPGYAPEIKLEYMLVECSE